jgi:hypothetical protein
MKIIICIILCIIGISLIITQLLQPPPCNKFSDLERKECSYLQVINNKNNHKMYKFLYYLNIIKGAICIILSIIIFIKK